MNDYNIFFEHKCHIDHVETLEEASEFCKAYGAELKKYAQDKEKEMEESGAVRENKDILIVLIILGAVLFVLEMSSEFETSIGAAVYSGLMYGVIIPSISRCMGRIKYAESIRDRANSFIELRELKGMTEERVLEYTNDLVDRYNRMVDDDELIITNVYNHNFKRNPEKNANIAIAMMGILIFVIILFCIIKELMV